MCPKDVVRYGYESVTCGFTCPRCVGVEIARGVACDSEVPLLWLELPKKEVYIVRRI